MEENKNSKIEAQKTFISTIYSGDKDISTFDVVDIPMPENKVMYIVAIIRKDGKHSELMIYDDDMERTILEDNLEVESIMYNKKNLKFYLNDMEAPDEFDVTEQIIFNKEKKYIYHIPKEETDNTISSSYANYNTKRDGISVVPKLANSDKNLVDIITGELRDQMEEICDMLGITYKELKNGYIYFDFNKYRPIYKNLLRGYSQSIVQAKNGDYLLFTVIPLLNDKEEALKIVNLNKRKVIFDQRKQANNFIGCNNLFCVLDKNNKAKEFIMGGEYDNMVFGGDRINYIIPQARIIIEKDGSCKIEPTKENSPMTFESEKLVKYGASRYFLIEKIIKDDLNQIQIYDGDNDKIIGSDYYARRTKDSFIHSMFEIDQDDKKIFFLESAMKGEDENNRKFIMRKYEFDKDGKLIKNIPYYVQNNKSSNSSQKNNALSDLLALDNELFTSLDHEKNSEGIFRERANSGIVFNKSGEDDRIIKKTNARYIVLERITNNNSRGIKVYYIHRLLLVDIKNDRVVCKLNAGDTTAWRNSIPRQSSYSITDNGKYIWFLDYKYNDSIEYNFHDEAYGDILRKLYGKYRLRVFDVAKEKKYDFNINFNRKGKDILSISLTRSKKEELLFDLEEEEKNIDKSDSIWQVITSTTSENEESKFTIPIVRDMLNARLPGAIEKMISSKTKDDIEK